MREQSSCFISRSTLNLPSLFFFNITNFLNCGKVKFASFKVYNSVCLHFFLIFLKFYLFLFFIYLFLAALGLHCCAQAFSSCGEQGLLFVMVCRLLIVVASLVAEHGL